MDQFISFSAINAIRRIDIGDIVTINPASYIATGDLVACYPDFRLHEYQPGMVNTIGRVVASCIDPKKPYHLH